MRSSRPTRGRRRLWRFPLCFSELQTRNLQNGDEEEEPRECRGREGPSGGRERRRGREIFARKEFLRVLRTFPLKPRTAALEVFEEGSAGRKTFLSGGGGCDGGRVRIRRKLREASAERRTLRRRSGGGLGSGFGVRVSARKTRQDEARQRLRTRPRLNWRGPAVCRATGEGGLRTAQRLSCCRGHGRRERRALRRASAAGEEDPWWPRQSDGRRR